MTSFARETCPSVASLSHVAFRERFTEVNALYWSSIPLIQILGREAKLHEADEYTVETLRLTGPDIRRFNWTLGRYEQHVKAHATWTRANAVLALASALETYTSGVVRAAVLSDPIGIPGWPKPLDGIVLLKLQRQQVPDLEPFVKGTWHARLAAYERRFGSVPTLVRDREYPVWLYATNRGARPLILVA